jgi:hypothetical protein
MYSTSGTMAAVTDARVTASVSKRLGKRTYQLYCYCRRIGKHYVEALDSGGKSNARRGFP